MDDPLGTLMFLFGVGFLAANLFAARVCVQDWRRRRDAILAWRMPPPRYAAVPVLISVGLGLLIVYKLVVLEWHVRRLFGEAMMLTYYGYLYPLSLRLPTGVLRAGRPPRPRVRDMAGDHGPDLAPRGAARADCRAYAPAGRPADRAPRTPRRRPPGAARSHRRSPDPLHARAPRPRGARRAAGCIGEEVRVASSQKSEEHATLRLVCFWLLTSVSGLTGY